MRRAILLTLLLVVGCGKEVSAPAPMVRKPAPAPPVRPTVVVTRVDDGRMPAALLARCKAATVLVGNFEGGKLRSTGSGVVVGDGRTVVTNRHVVVGDDEKPDALKLVFRPGTPQARIVVVPATAVTISPEGGDDDKTDVAAIRLGAVVAPPLADAPASEAEETASVWALGFPNGLSIRTSEKALPSATIHTLRLERVEKVEGKPTVLQLAGSATYGDSGGPVVSRTGRVLGIMQALADRRSSIVYALPVDAVRRVVARSKGGGDLVASFTADLAPEPTRPVAPPRRADPVERRSVRESGGGGNGPRDLGASTLATVEVDDALLNALSPVELTVLRNEPFARRGYIFSRAPLRAAFANTGWYVPLTRDLRAIQRRLTRREKRNIDAVLRYQKATGKQW